jgi:hypothetical protein
MFLATSTLVSVMGVIIQKYGIPQWRKSVFDMCHTWFEHLLIIKLVTYACLDATTAYSISKLQILVLMWRVT